MGDALLLDQSVSLDGSIWNLNVTDDLGLEQGFSDFYGESADNALGLTGVAIGCVCHRRTVENQLTLSDSFTMAGCLCTEPPDDATKLTAMFDSSAAIGRPLYMRLNGHVELAHAANLSTSYVVGLACELVAASTSGQYSTDGIITADNWVGATGQIKLVTGRQYFLDRQFIGRMSLNPPTADGEVVVPLGHAVDENTFNIEIQTPVLL